MGVVVGVNTLKHRHNTDLRIGPGANEDHYPQMQRASRSYLEELPRTRVLLAGLEPGQWPRPQCLPSKSHAPFMAERSSPSPPSFGKYYPPNCTACHHLVGKASTQSSYASPADVRCPQSNAPENAQQGWKWVPHLRCFHISAGIGGPSRHSHTHSIHGKNVRAPRLESMMPFQRGCYWTSHTGVAHDAETLAALAGF